MPRTEDARLLTGLGRYLADHDVAGLHHVAFARSTLAHADIAGIDVAAAATLDGVVAVVTAADLRAAGARPLSHRLAPPYQPLSWELLAVDRVRHVGEPVVAVVAASRAVAEDAVELLDIDYRELPPVVGPAAAMAPGAPLLYPEWGTNEFVHLEGSTAGVEEALAAAPHRLQESFESHRVIGLPLEAHGAQGSWDPARGQLTLISSAQQPHQLRSVVAEACGLREAAVRVISPDMGGGFGNKQHFTREECLVGMLAIMTGRPLRWSADRTEALTASVHSRPQVHHVDAGFDDRGRVVALRVAVTSDLGHPVLYFSGIGPSLVTVGALSGGYAFPEVGWSLSAVATTTCPVGAYRGFGQPQAHLSTERVLDRIAQRLGVDPLDVRRANLLPAEPRPWRTYSGGLVDCGDLHAMVDTLVAEFGYHEWRHRQAEARSAGRHLGVGLSTLVQGTAPNQHDTAARFGSLETAMVTVLPDATVTVAVGTKSQGQGHETVFAQIAADALGVGPEAVTVADGDTGRLPYGQGTWGSRSTVMGGGAVVTACRRLRARMAAIAAHLGLTLPEEGPVDADVLAAVAATAWWVQHRLPPGVEPGLSTTVTYTPGRTNPSADGLQNHDETYSSHMTAVAVEVDPATGSVTVLDALCVSDCGVVVNPTLVEGQHQGAFAQGLGNVLWEEVRYSPDGQPLCATLLDYTIPSSLDVPRLRVVHQPTPSATAGGFRGVGEAGLIALPAAMVGAVEDALSPLGVRLNSTRLHPPAIRAAVRATGWRPDPAAWAAAGLEDRRR
ncbi:xanthine dehydrogenase family protein molybdopterin-binding subunit [Acidiferrimicrobium sp. IK]|uniref:xanthine dehydrogenase family protein molybdopterin-binding subunit n=1 Tax=Acidiferrimicrobium sp. IK TaxID=2871700 RepID=UPI0021CB980E|nr:xanthine dehydrogenase family protein molybdopterin-binding subunit [Acidiferrimicrobium sp. IK]MCU4184488.1 xanthine dehydrogenase family protein molybdopterin-binding subunit [Acidiferrimicrobium sp. IK]